MVRPKVLMKSGNVELWQFRGQYFAAFIFSDGAVQLFASDHEGRMFGHTLTSHNMHTRESTIEWLNNNVQP